MVSLAARSLQAVNLHMSLTILVKLKTSHNVCVGIFSDGHIAHQILVFKL